MRNWRKEPNERPWARDLSLGDLLTAEQAKPFQFSERLADFGYEVAENRLLGTWVVVRKSAV